MPNTGNDISWLGTEELSKIIQELEESQQLELTIFAMIERKESELSLLHLQGELSFKLHRIFEVMDSRIKALEGKITDLEAPDDPDPDYEEVEIEPLSRRLLDLFQKADEVKEEIGSIRDDFLNGGL